MEKIKNKIEKYINKTGVIRTPAYFIKDLFTQIVDKIDEIKNNYLTNNVFNEYKDKNKFFNDGYSYIRFNGLHIFNTEINLNCIESLYIIGLGYCLPSHYIMRDLKDIQAFIKFKNNIIPDRLFKGVSEIIEFKLTNIKYIGYDFLDTGKLFLIDDPGTIDAETVNTNMLAYAKFTNKVRNLYNGYIYVSYGDIGVNGVLELPKGLHNFNGLPSTEQVNTFIYPLNIKNVIITDSDNGHYIVKHLEFKGHLKTLNIKGTYNLKTIKFYSKRPPKEILVNYKSSYTETDKIVYIPKTAVDYDVTIWENIGFEVQYFDHRCIGDEGIYIIDDNGFLYTKEEWDFTKNPIGVYVSNGEHYIIIYLYDLGHFLPNYRDISGNYTTTKEEALLDLNGYKNTHNIISSYTNSESNSSKFHNYEFCSKFEFELGNRAYVGSGGEWMLVADNINDINSILEFLKGDVIDTDSKYATSSLPFHFIRNDLSEGVTSYTLVGPIFRPFMQFDYPELEEPAETN